MTKQNADVLIFDGKREDNIFSNYYRHDFTLENEIFYCVKQYLLFKRAKHFRVSKKWVQEILVCDARIERLCKLEQKVERHARRKNFYCKHLNKKYCKYLRKALSAKFTDATLVRTLLETKNKIIGQAGENSFWSIGHNINDPGAMKPELWLNGKNNSGKALMCVRQKLQQKFDSLKLIRV